MSAPARDTALGSDSACSSLASSSYPGACPTTIHHRQDPPYPSVRRGEPQIFCATTRRSVRIPAIDCCVSPWIGSPVRTFTLVPRLADHRVRSPRARPTPFGSPDGLRNGPRTHALPSPRTPFACRLSGTRTGASRRIVVVVAGEPGRVFDRVAARAAHSARAPSSGPRKVLTGTTIVLGNHATGGPRDRHRPRIRRLAGLHSFALRISDCVWAPAEPEARLADPGLVFPVGYGQQNPFQHAFKRWVGVTPGEFRARHLPR
jgi:hypothetical protein